MTQREVAERAGIDFRLVSRLERGGVRDPRLSTLVKVARALEVEVSDLL